MPLSGLRNDGVDTASFDHGHPLSEVPPTFPNFDIVRVEIRLSRDRPLSPRHDVGPNALGFSS